MSTRARLQRLRAELKSDERSASERLAQLEAMHLEPNASTAELALAAVDLHHAYGAVEALLSRLASGLGEGVPEGPDSHQALLTSMSLEVEGVRPPVISAATGRHLRSLLGFRHFFRHAYAVALDAARLRALRDEAVALRPLLEADLERLDAFLRELAERAGD